MEINLEPGTHIGTKYQPGDHACCIYASEEEQQAAVVPFLVEGLQRGQRVVYIHDTHSAQDICDWLEPAGIDCADAVRRGQLVFLTPEQTYLKSGDFQPEKMIEILRNFTRSTLAEGYPALRITAETGWAARVPGASQRLIEYEICVNDFFDHEPFCIGICQYDRHALDPDVLLDILMAHPLVLWGSQVMRNFYYLPPEVFLNGKKSAARLDRWISNLRDRQQAEDKLALFHSIVETSHEAISVIDMQDQFVYINPAQQKMMGVTFEEARLDGFYRYFSQDSARVLSGEVAEALRNGTGWEGELEVRNGDGRRFPVRAQVDSLREADGSLRYAIALAHEISERKATEAALRESEKRFRMVSELVTDYAYVMRLAADGRLAPEWITDAFFRLAGYKPGELPQERWIERIHPEDVPMISDRGDTLRSGQSGVLEYRIVSLDSTVHWVRDYARPLIDPDTGQVTGVMGAVQEITAQKEIEEALRRSEERFRKLVEDAPAAIGISRQGIIQYINPAYLSLFGYDAADEVVGQPVSSQFTAESAEDIFNRSIAREQDGIAETACEVMGRRKNGAEISLLVSSDLIDLPDGLATLAYIVDVSDRKRAMEALQSSEKRFRQLFEQAPLGYQSLDANGCFLDVNQAWCDRLGYTHAEVLGRWFGDFLTPESAEKVRVRFPKFIEIGEISGSEFEMIRKDETTFLASFDGRIGVDEHGQFQRTHCLMTDITEQRRAQERVQAALAEKEIMLREIHHRVKNNLQVMISLLSLQAETMGNAALKSALQESKDRIRTMAIAHEELYQSGDLAQVDIALYLDKLVNGLFLSYQPERTIRPLIEVDDDTLPVDQAIPLGLLVNELVTNALKHAFHPGESGEVGVSFHREGQQYHLRVWDSGVGLPAGLDMQNTTSLGLNLVHILTRQLNGELVASCAPGARFDLIFQTRADSRGLAR